MLEGFVLKELKYSHCNKANLLHIDFDYKTLYGLPETIWTSVEIN